MSELNNTALEPFAPDDPEPLFRPLVPPERFPIEALPAVLRRGVEGIVARVLCPREIAINSVLAAVSVIAQAFVNIVLHTGQVRPTSLNIVTVALSGERKTSADDDAMAPIHDYEAQLRAKSVDDQDQHRRDLVAWNAREKEILQKKNDPDREQKLADLGPAPLAPFEPAIICDEPTFEGLTRLLAEGLGFAGVCSSEGGQFLGGYAMNPDNKLKSAAHFSKLWDGAPIRRTRGGDGSIVLANRRATMHLMVQPGVGDSFLRDRMLRDQGFHSRVLLAGPASRIGKRQFKEPTEAEKQAYAEYADCLTKLLCRDPPRPDPTRAELAPRSVVLTPEARTLLIDYYNEVEGELGPTGALREISGFANKLPEHAARLAGVFCFASDPDTVAVDACTMADAIVVARWYASEALRLYNAGYLSAELQDAEAVRQWLLNQWQHTHISVADLLQRGPNALRDKPTLEQAVATLERAGWLVAVDVGAQIGRNHRRKSWRVVRGRQL